MNPETYTETEFRLRLTAAFTALRRLKLVARQNFSCCGGCACAELGDYMKDRPRFIGAVYYHRQDAEGMVSRRGELRGVYLGFSAREGAADAETIKVGAAVVTTLAAYGLVPEWDGTSVNRIFVKPAKPAMQS